MKKANTAALFDLDGTLLDTASDFVGVLRTQCARHQRAMPDEQQIRNTVSDGARALVKLAFKLTENDPYFEERRLELLDIYEQQLGQHTRLFDGMQTVLNLVKELGMPWGIVTNKPRRFAEPLMKHMNLSPTMAVLVCPDDVSNTKPDPEPMLKAANAVGLSPENCLYVGDHKRDIEAGINANMTTVTAAYGYVHTQQEAASWSADYLVNSAAELAPIISDFHRARADKTAAN